MELIINRLAATRPTAVNLFWALQRMKKIAHAGFKEEDIVAALETEAINIERQDIETNKKIGYYGAELLGSRETVLTHCNTGALATAGYGTALGVIRKLYKNNKKIKIFVDETRPYLQGARLTAWELTKLKIPFYLITDNSAGFLMKKGLVEAVIVGADRIVRNGDTANKIGTYSLSVLAKENNVPFYVAAPISTFDMTIKNGKEIPIEERSGKEITHIFSEQISPDNIQTFNPAFDVTPNRNITGIITEKGIITEPFQENIRSVINVD